MHYKIWSHKIEKKNGMEIRCDWTFDVELYLKYARRKWLKNKE